MKVQPQVSNQSTTNFLSNLTDMTSSFFGTGGDILTLGLLESVYWLLVMTHLLSSNFLLNKSLISLSISTCLILLFT